MTALKNMPISFPGLFGDWEFTMDPVAIDIGHGIYWYGIILAFAMLAGLFLAMKQSKHYGLTEDHVMDMALIAVPCCIIGSRIYYVLFNLDLYRTESGGLDWGSMIAIWDGGIAIYGTVIMGVIVAVAFARWKKIKLAALTDLAVLGLLLGQIIGR
ncbi:MAG: prolipoprotein diacylglyceryl transferase, partial [Oscillibacter sp.]|nr:prolipoprotein diacylglyceryl transferase [Oscillibacter sp.]